MLVPFRNRKECRKAHRIGIIHIVEYFCQVRTGSTAVSELRIDMQVYCGCLRRLVADIVLENVVPVIYIGIEKIGFRNIEDT